MKQPQKTFGSLFQSRHGMGIGLGTSTLPMFTTVTSDYAVTSW